MSVIRPFFGFFEYLPHLPLGLTDVLVEQLRSFDVEEVAAYLLTRQMPQFFGNGIRHGLGNQRLPTSGRTVQQDPFRSAQLIIGKNIGMQERQLYCVPHLFDFFLQPADVVIIDIGNFLQHEFLRLRLRQLLDDAAGSGVVQQMISDTQAFAQ